MKRSGSRHLVVLASAGVAIALGLAIGFGSRNRSVHTAAAREHRVAEAVRREDRLDGLAVPPGGGEPSLAVNESVEDRHAVVQWIWVVSAETGEPIPAATMRPVTSEDGPLRGGSPHPARDATVRGSGIAISGGDGRLRVEGLVDSRMYFIGAPGYAWKVVDVPAAGGDVLVRLRRAGVIRLRITGGGDSRRPVVQVVNLGSGATYTLNPVDSLGVSESDAILPGIYKVYCGRKCEVSPSQVEVLAGEAIDVLLEMGDEAEVCVYGSVTLPRSWSDPLDSLDFTALSAGLRHGVEHVSARVEPGSTGSYEARLSAPGEYVVNLWDQGWSSRIAVVDSVTRFDIVVPDPGELAVSVFDDEGHELEWAGTIEWALRVGPESGGMSLYRSVKSRKGGAPVRLLGEVGFRVVIDGFVQENSSIVEVRSGERATESVIVHRSGRVAVHVTANSRAAGGSRVILERVLASGERVSFGTSADDAGIAEFDALLPGDYEVVGVRMPGFKFVGPRAVRVRPGEVAILNVAVEAE